MQNDNEIDVPPDAPAPPSILNDIGEEKFYAVFQRLKAENLWRPSMVDSVTMVSSLWEELVKIAREIEGRTAVTEGRTGEDVLDPLIKEKRRYWNKYKIALNELGLTPNSRGQIATEGLESPNKEEEKKSEMEKIYGDD